MGVFLPQRWRQQPQGPAALAQSSDPPAVAMCGSAGLVDLVQNRSVSRTATNLRAVPTGVAIDFPTAAVSRTVGAYTSFRGPSALTGIAVWRPTAGAQWYQADGLSRWFVSNRTAGNAGWSWGRVQAVDGGALGNLTKQSFVLQGVAQYTSTSNTVPSLCATAVAFVWNGSSIQFYDDAGLKTPIARDSIATGSLSAGGDLVVGGQGEAGLSGWLGSFEMFALWPRALPQARVLDLLANPYQLFRPLRQIIYSFPSSATIPTLSNATVTDIGTYTARPRVTVTF